MLPGLKKFMGFRSCESRAIAEPVKPVITTIDYSRAGIYECNLNTSGPIPIPEYTEVMSLFNRIPVYKPIKNMDVMCSIPKFIINDEAFVNGQSFEQISLRTSLSTYDNRLCIELPNKDLVVRYKHFKNGNVKIFKVVGDDFIRLVEDDLTESIICLDYQYMNPGTLFVFTTGIFNQLTVSVRIAQCNHIGSMFKIFTKVACTEVGVVKKEIYNQEFDLDHKELTDLLKNMDRKLKELNVTEYNIDIPMPITTKIFKSTINNDLPLMQLEI